MDVEGILYNPGIDNIPKEGSFRAKAKYGDFALETQLGYFSNPILIHDQSSTVVGGIYETESSRLQSFYFKTREHEILIQEFEDIRQFINVYICLKDSNGRYIQFGEIKEADVSQLDKCIIILVTDLSFYIIKDSDGMAVSKFHRVGNTLYSRWPQFETYSNGKKLCVNEGEYRDLLNFQILDIQDKPKVLKSYSDEANRLSTTFDYNGFSHFYFTLNHSKEAIIANKYATDKLSPVCIKNEFDDDDSINIEVEISNNDMEAIGLLGRINSRQIEHFLIYGISPVDIIIASIEAPGYSALVESTSDEYIKTCKAIFYKIMENHKYDETEAAKYIYGKYCKYCFDDSLAVIYGEKLAFNNKKQEQYKQLYNDIYEQMIVAGEVIPKWKSEADLFTLVKEHLKDALYQYRDTMLLGYQSLDIYVPSKKLAFEYQGIQHYKNVDFFGGEEGFKKRQLLDERKREICKNNNIILIEWRYDEPISVITLKYKLEKIGIIFDC